MCMICVDLIKLNMTLKEAERASTEIVQTVKPGDDNSEHYQELNEAIKDLDLDTLSEILDEGTKK